MSVSESVRKSVSESVRKSVSESVRKSVSVRKKGVYERLESRESGVCGLAAQGLPFLFPSAFF